MKILFFSPEQYVDFKDEPSNYQLRLPMLNCGLVTAHRDYIYQRVLRSEGRDAMNAKALQEVKEFKPHLVVYSTSWLHECPDSFVFREIMNMGIPVYTHVWDTSIHQPQPHVKEWFDNCNYFAIADSITNYLFYKNLAKNHPNVKGVIFPGGNDVFTDLLRPLPVEKISDVTILGSREGQRVQLIEFLHKKLEKHKISFSKLGGLVDSTQNTSNSLSDKWVSWTEYAKIINQSRICISSQTQPNRLQIKGKVFDYLSCGSLCFSESNPELFRIVPDHCIVYYDSFEDCLQKIIYYVEHPEEGQKIATAGYDWFCKTFDYKKFWSQFLKVVTKGERKLPTVELKPEASLYQSLRDALAQKGSLVLYQSYGLNIQGHNIPQNYSPVLESLLRKIATKQMKVLEIGSWKGMATAVMGGVLSEYEGTLFAIDHWKGSSSVPAMEWEARGTDIFNIFIQNMKILGLLNKIVKPIVMESTAAAEIFQDNSVDFIFIDGDHSYSSIKQDLLAWLPKLKAGGAICGHCTEGYYSQYSETVKAEIDRQCEIDWIITEEGGVHPGVVKATYEVFGNKYEIIPGTSIWYYQKKAIDSQWSVGSSKPNKLNPYYAAHVKILLNLLGETTQEEPGQGSIYQIERISLVAQYCIQGWNGNLIQLGFQGREATKKLAELAKKSHRRLVIVPLAEAGTTESSSNWEETLFKHIEQYKDVVSIIQSDSLTEDTIESIKHQEFCFALIDGFDTYDTCLTAIKTVTCCSGVIAVDNISESQEISRAFLQGSELTNRSKLYLPLCRESYLLWS